MAEMEEVAGRCADELESALRNEGSFVEVYKFHRGHYLQGNAVGLVRLAIAALRVISDFQEAKDHYERTRTSLAPSGPPPLNPLNPLETSASLKKESVTQVRLDTHRKITDQGNVEFVEEKPSFKGPLLVFGYICFWFSGYVFWTIGVIASGRWVLNLLMG